MISSMRIENATEVAEIHHLYIKSLLADLGKRMCLVFYKTALRSERNFGFVYYHHSKIVAFVFGTTDTSRLFDHPRIRIETGLALLRKPFLVKKLISHMSVKFPATAEPLYGAIIPEFRGMGISDGVMQRFEQELRYRGVDYYELSVDADNIACQKLFKRFGSKIIREFTEGDTPRVRFSVRLDI